MTFIQKLFSGSAGELINSVGNLVDNITTTKEEKMHYGLEMKKADMQYKVEMKKLMVEEKQLYYYDLNSARNRDAAIQTSQFSTILAKNTPYYLAIGTTLLTFSLFAVLIIFNAKICASAKEIVLYILGVLSAIITQIFSYYFGSSQGSADKSRVLEEMNIRSETIKED